MPTFIFNIILGAFNHIFSLLTHFYFFIYMFDFVSFGPPQFGALKKNQLINRSLQLLN